jgi:glycosyltransferase involved in cell wall biosynthesis
VEILPNGIDREAVAAACPAGGSWDLLYAGRLIAEKRLDLLVDAVPGLLARHPDLRVLVIGDGPERAALEERASRPGVRGHITFLGFLPGPGEVIGYMKASGVFVSPSVREGFGMAALEAMACGIPVVTVEHPQNAVMERVTPRTGRIARPTSEDLGEKIAECLEDPSRFREGCLAMAAAHDWDAIVSRAEAYYRRVAAG